MRNVSRILPLLPGIAMLSGCNNAAQKSNGQNDQKPNIIYIFADDLGIGDLSCYGATKVSTPNIDRLAGQGVQFTNAYATSATSTPSRFGLLTGMYPWRQKNTGIAPGNSELIIDTACVTMADMLKDAGYATGAVGKWHLGLGPKGGTDFNKQITPNAQSIGFDYEFIIPATVDRVPCVFVENGRVVGLDPNDPITVNYEHKVGDWPTGEENPELVTLKPSQGHNNTIINGIPRIGWMTGGKSALWKDEDIADIITHKAKKFITSHKEEPFFLYMGTQDVHVPRIPFIVRWPAKVKPSKQQSLFSQIDVYASLASLLNQPLRKGAAPDSQEHLNTFLGRNNTGREYIVQQNLNNTLAIVKGQWKYIEPSDAPAIEFWTKMELGNDQQPQLYDLSSDPSEKTNVAKQHPDIVKELAELLESVKEK